MLEEIGIRNLEQFVIHRNKIKSILVLAKEIIENVTK